MRRPKKDIQLTSYDELLGLEETPEKSMNQVVEIDLAKLYPFKNHPFHVNDDEKMAETVESIKTYGVLTPALVRPRPDGGYEMISGHRRKRGCELCGKTTLPALVRNYTDDEAVIIMVDSNIQRENLLPSEKAHAYKMKYDAMKHQGSKGEKYTADMVGEAAGDSGRTVQRYIRLAALSDALLEYVDNNKIPMIVGEKLSYLKPEEQGWLLEVITNSSIFPTKQQAEQLKECSANGKLNQSYIYAVLLKKESSKINVTLPAKKNNVGHRHPNTIALEEVERIFTGMGYEVVEGPEVEYDYYNFEALNIPANHPAKDEQDTFYINDKIVLRTQTSPVQVREMEKGHLPIRMIAPGRVFRADEVDATHSPSFHQIEGLVVDKNITFSDLKGTLAEFARQLFGQDTKVKFRPHHFPFTEPSAEMDVTCFKCGGKGCRFCKGEGWIEILGCGMVHPRVLRMSGIDPEEYSGFAFGIGLERIALLKYEIDDMRLLYENDQRFLNQF